MTRTAPLALAVFLIACPPAPPGDAGPTPTDAGDTTDSGSPVVDAGPPPPLAINEVMARNNAILADELGEFEDWIEIKNTSSTVVSLAGVTLTDNEDEPQAYRFPNESLGPGEFFIVFCDDEVADGSAHAPFRLAGGGETVFLFQGGREIDQLTFGELAVDQTFGISNTGEATVLATPSPRGENGVSAARDLPAVSGVVINEVLASNLTGLVDETGVPEDWVELLNTTDAEVDLSFHHLSDTADAPFQFTFAADTALGAGAFLIVFLDGEPAQGPLHAGFGVAAAGDALFLSSPDGETILDQVAFGAQVGDVSFARVPDGDGAFSAQAPTPGGNNAVEVDEDAGPAVDAGPDGG